MPTVVAGAVSLFTGAAFGGGALGALAQFGAGLVLNAAAQKLLAPRVSSFRVEGQNVAVREPVSPRLMVYGATRVGGTVVFIHSTGPKREYLHLVIALANHSCRSIGRVYFNDVEAVAADGTPSEDYTGLISIEKRLGAEDQLAFSGLLEEAPDKWTEDHRLAGCTCVHLRLVWNGDAFATGLPNISFEVEGKDDIYDPRTDARGYTSNAMLCTADYMADPVNGMGVPIGEPGGIALDSMIESANICDEDVPLQAGGTEKRYTCNGVVVLDRTPKAIIEELLTASVGRAALQGVTWDLIAGAYRVPSVALTDKDKRGALRVTTRLTASENFNGVRGQFVSPENEYQPDDFPAYQSSAYVDEDQGEERWRDIVLPYTDTASAAQRIAKITCERARRQLAVEFEGKLSAFRLAVGDTATLDHARWGFDVKPFEAAGVTLTAEEGQLLPDLFLRETSPLVYQWASSEEQIYAAAPRTSLPSAFDVSPPGQPQLFDDLYVTRGGAKALLRIEWSESTSGFTREYQVQARRVAEPDGTTTGDDWITMGRTDQLFWEVRDIAAGQWEARVKALNEVGIGSEYVSASKAILGLSAAPVPLVGVTIQTAGGLAVLKWAKSQDLDVQIGGRVVIRHSASAIPSWSNSVSMDAVAGSDAIAVVPLKPGVYFLRAEDATGIQGGEVSVASKGAQAIGFANLDTLVAHPVWAGPMTNAEVNGFGELTLTDPSLAGRYEFATGIDFGLVRRVRMRSQIEVSAINLTSTIDERTDDIDDWLDFDDTQNAEIDVVVEMRTTDDDPAGSPIWSTWSRLDSSEDEFRAAEMRAELSTGSENINLLVAALSVTADEVT